MIADTQAAHDAQRALGQTALVISRQRLLKTGETLLTLKAARCNQNDTGLFIRFSESYRHFHYQYGAEARGFI